LGKQTLTLKLLSCVIRKSEGGSLALELASAPVPHQINHVRAAPSNPEFLGTLVSRYPYRRHVDRPPTLRSAS
jgi:hypothetical protein